MWKFPGILFAPAVLTLAAHGQSVNVDLQSANSPFGGKPRRSNARSEPNGSLEPCAAVPGGIDGPG